MITIVSSKEAARTARLKQPHLRLADDGGSYRTDGGPEHTVEYMVRQRAIARRRTDHSSRMLKDTNG